MSDDFWVIATGNAGKAAELAELLRPLQISVVRPDRFGGAIEVEEWGDTFATNAVLKAVAYAAQTGRVSVADDSGLEVRALGWAPGVHSARYAGDLCDDEANNRKLVAALEEVEGEGRDARYRCVIAVAWKPSTDIDETEFEERRVEDVEPNGHFRVDGWRVSTFDGSCEGRIARTPRGTGGFGYDPYFVVPDGRHMAELDAESKHGLSHRGAAMRKLVAYLQTVPAAWSR